MMGIYCIENLVDHKKYIGKGTSIKGRWACHKNKLRNNKHENKFLQNAWNKYNEDNFNFYVIEECSKEKLSEREIYYIKECNTKSPNGYNLTGGGDGINDPSEETRRKMSIAQKGKFVSPEVGKKISIANKGRVGSWVGRHHTEEEKKKMSLCEIGEKNYWFGKKRENSSSKYYGVSMFRSGNYIYWEASTKVNSKKVALGIYKLEIDAAKAYNRYIIENNLPNPLNQL